MKKIPILGMWCYGKKEIMHSPTYCYRNCCEIERDLCFKDTMDKIDKEEQERVED